MYYVECVIFTVMEAVQKLEATIENETLNPEVGGYSRKLKN